LGGEVVDEMGDMVDGEIVDDEMVEDEMVDGEMGWKEEEGMIW